MRCTRFTTLFGYLVLTVSSALAQATTTPPGTAPGTASTPGVGAGGGAAAGGVANWWWIILAVLVVDAALWSFMRGRGGRV